MIDIQFKIH